MAGTKTRKLEVVIAGDASGALRAFGDVESRSGRLGRGMRGALTLGAAGFSAVAAGAALGGAALFQIGSDFDNAYDTIRVGTGATGTELERLKETFRGVVRDVPATFAEASQAVTMLNSRLGLAGPQLEAVAEPMLDLTRLTGGDLETNVSNLSRVFGDWNIGARQMPGTLDQIYRASTETGAGVDSLAANVVQFGAPLRQMGFSLEESLALFGRFEAEGVNIGTVLGGMRRGLAGFAQDGEAPADALARVSEEIQSAGSVADANRLAIEVFGARAGPDMAAAIREGRFELDELVGAIAGGSGTIAGAADDTADFGEKWQEIKNRVFLALEPAAVGLFDAIGQAMDALGPIAETVGAWLGERLPGWIETGRTAVENLRPTFDSILSTVREVWPGISSTISTAVETISSIVGAVVETVVVIWRNFGDDVLRFVRRAWGPVSNIIGGTLNTIRGVISAVLAVIRGDWSGAWEGIKTAVAGVWQNIRGTVGLAIAAVRGVIDLGMQLLANGWGVVWRGIQTIVRGVWSTIVGLVTGYVNTVRTVVTTAWNVLGRVTSRIWSGIRALIRRVWSAIVAVVRTYVGSVRTVVSGAWNTVRNLSSSAWNGIRNVIGNVWSRIVDRVRNGVERVVDVVRSIPNRIASFASGLFSGLVDAFRSAINSIIRWWNNLELSIDPPGPGSITVGTPNIPELADGGTARTGGLALVGELGPELVSLPRGATVYPTGTTFGRDAGRPVEVHVHVHGPMIGSNEADVERTIVAALERARRRGLVRS